MNGFAIYLERNGVVIVAGQHLETGAGADAETIASNLKLILARLKASNPAMPIILSQVFPSSATKKRPVDQIKKIKSVALALGLPVDQAALAAAESMDKLAAVLANPQGAGSDARLAIMQAANPSAHNTPEGLSLIVRQLQGLSDHAQAMQALAARFPDKSKYADFEAGVGRALDPRAFMIERMTAEQKRDYFKHLTPRDQADVMRAHDFARANGLLGGANGR